MLVSDNFERRRSSDLRKRDLKPLLNGFQNLLIGLRAHERNRNTLGSETPGTTNTMKVGVSIAWKIIVDSQVDTLDIDTTTKDVSGYADALIEFLELLVPLDSGR
jgi:hypothetical protein